MNDVITEFVKRYATQTQNVVQIRYAKIAYVLKVVTVIHHVLITKHVSTNNAEVP